MVSFTIAFGVLVLLGFGYLIIAHYVLAVEIGEDVKKIPPDVKLLPLDPKE